MLRTLVIVLDTIMLALFVPGGIFTIAALFTKHKLIKRGRGKCISL